MQYNTTAFTYTLLVYPTEAAFTCTLLVYPTETDFTCTLLVYPTETAFTCTLLADTPGGRWGTAPIKQRDS